MSCIVGYNSDTGRVTSREGQVESDKLKVTGQEKKVKSDKSIVKSQW